MPSFFVPTPFTSPVVAPRTATLFNGIPYISPSGYRFAPTSVGTQALVPGSTNQAVDSLASLAQEAARASSWVNEICFHDGEGSLAASIITDADYFFVKPGGHVSVICNYKPIIEVLGMGVGANPAQMSSLDPTSAGAITFSDTVIDIPSFAVGLGPVPYFGQWPSLNGNVYIVWQYVAGFPHTSLAADAALGATTIQVTASDLAGVSFVGVDAHTAPTQLVIKDGAATETIVVNSISGLTCSLASPLQFAHTVPVAPDFIPVTAVPWAVEQAAISLTSVLLKMRGTRSQVLAGAPGGPGHGDAMAEAGALGDFKNAMRLLKPFTTVYKR